MHLKVNGAYEAAYGGLKVRVVNQYRHVTRLYKKEDGVWHEIDMWASVVFKMQFQASLSNIDTTPIGFITEFHIRFGADTPIVCTGGIEVSTDNIAWGQTATAPAGQTILYTRVTKVIGVVNAVIGTMSMPKGSVTRWGTLDSADDVSGSGYRVNSEWTGGYPHARVPKIWVDTRIFSPQTQYITQTAIYTGETRTYGTIIRFSGDLPASLIGLGLHVNVQYYGESPLPANMTYCHMAVSYWWCECPLPEGIEHFHINGQVTDKTWTYNGELPETLTYLHLNANVRWTHTGPLPSGLTYLHINISMSTLIWDYTGPLPSGLTYLYLSRWNPSSIWTYTGALPAGLVDVSLVNCSNAHWTYTGALPTSIKTFSIYGCPNVNWNYTGPWHSGIERLYLGSWKTGAKWTYEGPLPTTLKSLSISSSNSWWTYTGALPSGLNENLYLGYCPNVNWNYTGALPAGLKTISFQGWMPGARWTYDGALPAGITSATFSGSIENVYWSCSGRNPVPLGGLLGIYNTGAHITLDTSGYYPPRTVQMSGENPNLVWVHKGPLYESFYTLQLYGAGINFNVTSPIQGQSQCNIVVSNNATFVYSGVTGNITTLHLKSPNANVSLPSGLGLVKSLDVGAGTIFTVPATLPSRMTYLKLDGDGITWDNASGLPRGLSSLYLKGQNINWRGWGAQQTWTCAGRSLSTSNMYIDVGNNPIPTVAEVNSFIIKLAAIATQGNATSTRTVTLKNTPTVADGVNITPLTNKGYNVILGD